MYLAEGDADFTATTSLPGDAAEAEAGADCRVGCQTCCVGFIVPAPPPLSITEALVRDAHSSEPLFGVTVGGTTDADGRIVLNDLPAGPQTLADGSRSDGYWIVGVMAERRFGPATFFLNFENLLDTKQTNYAPVMLGDRQNPRFADLWAPMDGFVVNGGVKYRF